MKDTWFRIQVNYIVESIRENKGNKLQFPNISIFIWIEVCSRIIFSKKFVQDNIDSLSIIPTLPEAKSRNLNFYLNRSLIRSIRRVNESS